MTHLYFLEIGLIILLVKFLSLITEKFRIPKVIGALIAGVLLGPAVLNVVHTSSFLNVLSKIAVIFIMFLAGMETRLKSFISGTKKFAIIAFAGALVSLAFGFLFSTLRTNDFTENLIFGLVLTSSSVSITIESLIELKKMKSNVGLAILGAGVFDDLIGVLFLTMIMHSSDLTANTIIIVLAKIFLFALVAVGIGFAVYTIFTLLGKILKTDDVPIYAIAYALIMAFIAEAFGISGIIGAYIAGLVLGATDNAKHVKKQVDSISNLFFEPIFFASIGLNLQSLAFSFQNWIFIFGLAAVALAAKIIGNGLGARICGYKKKDALSIGIGMSARGEVALIMLEAAVEFGLIQSEAFSIMLIAILIVDFVEPILLNMSFEKTKKEETELKTAESV